MKRSKTKTLKTAKADTWKVFSLWVRLKDSRHGLNQCYTCGLVGHVKDMHAGHALGGRHNAVLFDLFLVRPQCRQCNMYNNGQYNRFRLRLIDEFDQEWYDEKLRLCSKTGRIMKYTTADLDEMIEWFREDIKITSLNRQLEDI